MESYVGTKTSGVKAEVALTADTEIELTQWARIPYDITIKTIEITFANVVDAKAMTGYMELKSDQNRGPFRFPVGFGTGGAATLMQTKGYRLPVNIPCTKGETITLYATMNEACVGGFGCFEYVRGKSGPTTYGDCNTAEDAAISADTLTDFADIEIPVTKGGIVKKILVAYANIVNAKSAGGYVAITGDNLKGENHEYVVGGGSGGATNAGGSCEPYIKETEFGVIGGETLHPKLYISEAAVDGHIGVLWEGPE